MANRPAEAPTAAAEPAPVNDIPPPPTPTDLFPTDKP